jgi:hypothetical protein
LKSLTSRRPSPALVVSILALVVAMAGTSYAAFKLPKNSVGTKQIKKNAVTTAKIKNQAVTGKKVKKHTLTGNNINLAKLGTVPSATAATTATTAGTANVANSLSPLEVHVVGAPGQPGFENGFFNVANTELFPINTGPVAFYKDHEGIVHLEGLAATKAEGIELPSVFTLPPGYRPASGVLKLFAPSGAEVFVGGSGTSLAGHDLSGKVIAEAIALFDGISFRAES